MTSWKDKLSPEALERKRERDRIRHRKGDGYKAVCFRLKEDSEYIEILNSIPNKKQWLEKSLLEYKEQHKND